MSEITQKTLMEYQEYQKRVNNIAAELYEKARKVWIWENENLGTNHKYIDYSLKDDKECIAFYTSKYGRSIEFEEDYVVDKENFAIYAVYDSWAYGGYEEKELTIPLYKLLNDDWREAALKEYQEKQEVARKERETEEKIRAIKKEEKERAEYERLKAKFEQET